MTDDTEDMKPETPDDGDIEQELEQAMEKMHPGETPESDPFATDGLGATPPEPHDSWSE